MASRSFSRERGEKAAKRRRALSTVGSSEERSFTPVSGVTISATLAGRAEPVMRRVQRLESASTSRFAASLARTLDSLRAVAREVGAIMMAVRVSSSSFGLLSWEKNA